MIKNKAKSFLYFLYLRINNVRSNAKRIEAQIANIIKNTAKASLEDIFEKELNLL